MACSYVYASNGAHEQTFTVPSGVTAVTVDAIGASGGSSDPLVSPGRGARVAGDLTDLTAGQVLYIEVGGAGAEGVGGFNGGGTSQSGPGGGGATDVRTTSISTVADGSLTRATDSRLIVAAGGGGAGASGVTGPGGGTACAGGAGGDADAAGTDASALCVTSGKGGAAAPPASTPVVGDTLPGPLGQAPSTTAYGAGGGGGGYYGGSPGGGTSSDPGPDDKLGGGGGGGGGSSLVPSENPSGPTPTTAPASVTISYQVPYQLHTTALLGDTSVPRLTRSGLPASSQCPSGSFAIGARVWLDTFPRVTGVAALCTNGSGDPTPGPVLGDTSDAVSTADSLCSGSDRAVGLVAANGEVINAIGVRCAGTDGTVYNAAVVVGRPDQGTTSTVRHTADCDSGRTLTGIAGWYNIYGGPHNNLYGVEGICKARTSTTITAVSPASAAVVGQTVTVFYSVTADAGTPNGTVTVTGDNTTGCTGTAAAGSCTLAFTTEGSSSLTATYNDDADFVGSSSATVPYTVNPAPIVVPTCAPFSDVTVANRFCDDIAWAKERGITTGNTDGSFSPTAAVVRQAMAGFLYRYEHPGMTPPACTVKPFTDVPTSNVFCGDIAALKSEGVVKGNGDGTFSPATPVSRQTMAAFLYRIANPGKTAPACTSKPFSDVPTTNVFCGDIAYLIAQKITHGYPDGGFHPATVVARQEMAAFLHRLFVATQ